MMCLRYRTANGQFCAFSNCFFLFFVCMCVCGGGGGGVASNAFMQHFSTLKKTNFQSLSHSVVSAAALHL